MSAWSVSVPPAGTSVMKVVSPALETVVDGSTDSQPSSSTAEVAAASDVVAADGVLVAEGVGGPVVVGFGVVGLSADVGPPDELEVHAARNAVSTQTNPYLIGSRRRGPDDHRGSGRRPRSMLRWMTVTQPASDSIWWLSTGWVPGG